MRRGTVAGIVAVLVAVVLGIGLFRWIDDDPAEPEAHTGDAVVRAEVVEPLELARRRVITDADPCDTPAAKPFRPVSLAVPGLVGAQTVLALPRDSRGTPGVPPLGSGKQHVAWDAPGVLPGEPSGKVMLNAHAWPDRSALGDRFVAGLDVGERIVLSGRGGQRLCYEVTERTEVPFDDSAMINRVYALGGPPEAVMIVCSGTRTGPGEWSHRTVWFARPVGTA